jgi:hypothetical protein
MTEEFAWNIIVNAYKSASLITSLIPELRANSTEDEYLYYRKAMATLSADISLTILNPIFKTFPHLQPRVDQLFKEQGHL